MEIRELSFNERREAGAKQGTLTTKLVTFDAAKMTLNVTPATSTTACVSARRSLSARIRRSASRQPATGTRYCASNCTAATAQAKQRAQVERRAAVARAVDFRAVAQRWMEETLFYRSAGYRAQIARWLDA